MGNQLRSALWLTIHPPFLSAIQFVPSLFELVSANVAPEIQAGEFFEFIKRYFMEVGTAPAIKPLRVFHQPSPRLCSLSVQKHRRYEESIRDPLGVFQFPVDWLPSVPDRPLHQVTVSLLFRVFENRGFQWPFAVSVRLTGLGRDTS